MTFSKTKPVLHSYSTQVVEGTRAEKMRKKDNQNFGPFFSELTSRFSCNKTVTTTSQPFPGNISINYYLIIFRIDLDVSLGWAKSVCESIIVVKVQILRRQIISSNSAFFGQIFVFLWVLFQGVNFDIKMQSRLVYLNWSSGYN